ncbi:hypothetical protein [Nannocystis pusilla]|uniref:hypothetical protein n=1 Tax=Nannocystis pusilla TaxID=889268 RepID=UPI003BF42741
MTEIWNGRMRGRTAGFWCGLVAVTMVSGCDTDDRDNAVEQEVSAARVQVNPQDDLDTDPSTRMLRTMAGWAGTNDASRVSVEVARGDAALESIGSKNAMVVRDNGSVKFTFEANSEADGKELFGFFAQVALNGLDNAEQKTSIEVVRNPS